jgi:uncharacterized membrane protein YbhN (UPF0104 family)
MTRRLLIIGLKLAVIAAAIYYLVSTQRVNFLQLKINADSWTWLVLASALVIAQMVLLQIRLSILLTAAGIAIPLNRVVRAGLISWFINATMLGGLGALSADAVRAGYLLLDTNKRTSLFSMILFDRVMGLAALVSLACAMLAAGFLIEGFNEKIGALSFEIFYVLLCIGCAIAVIVLHEKTGITLAILLAAGALLAFGLIAFVLAGRPAELVWLMAGVVLAASSVLAILRFRAAANLSSSFLKSAQGMISEAIGTFLALRGRPLALLAGYACSITSYALTIFAIYLLAYAIQLEPKPTLLQTSIAAPVAFLTGVLPLPANGIGFGEIAFDAMLAIQQSPGAAALSGATLYLAFRLLSIVSASVGGIFFFVSRRTKSAAAKVD